MVAIPDIVRHYVPVFASVFSPEAFSQFQRDVSGVIGSENKTVDGINLSEAALFFIANRLTWQAHGITRIRRHRRPVEGDHEEGKADGLDQSQGRDFQAIYRPIALVAVTDSLRRAAQHAHALLHTLQRQIKTRRDGSAG